MQLEGRVQDLSLNEIFRMLKMTRKTGALKVFAGKRGGEVFLRDGEIYYAQSSLSGAPLGERLVKAGNLRQSELAIALEEQRRAEEPRVLAAVLKEKGLVPDDALERYLRDQIADAVFNLFTLAQAEFQFVPGGPPRVDDVVVCLDAEAVITEGCRRIDEWTVIMDSVGSLEKVPYLVPTTASEVGISRSEWEVICFIDGRRDINTIIADSGFDRFSTAKTVHRLLSSGMITIRDPTLELLGQKVAIGLIGPIDVYNEMFLRAVCSGELSSHLRIETVDDESFEVRISAGVREADEGDSLVYACEARTPLSVVKRMALETSGFVVLVNINSRDAVVASRRDIALMREIGDRPYMVAAYASLVDEQVSEEQVRELLELPEKVPVIKTGLRDPEETACVMSSLAGLIP